ncbi:exosortase A [Sphingobium subterraneum]|nr:exosortase A [Sphingobium subterraneum]
MDAGRIDLRDTWTRHLAGLLAVAAAILILFAHDVFDLVTIWWTSSTFSHCLFVPLLIGWLVQQRRAALRMIDPTVWMPGLAWVAAGNFAWLVGDAAGVGMIRHFGLVMMIQGAVLGMLGPAVGRGLVFPLCYAFFMVPFGAEIVPPLQLLTAKIAMALLGMVGVPAHIEGIFITIPSGYFEVAEACSGAKFVIAMAAYGVLVCHVCFRSWTRRALFLASALGLSVLANGVRAFATIYVAHKTSVDAAVGFDHVVYGWLFFGLVMAAVMATAWPFFDRKPGEVPFDPRNIPLAGVVARPVSSTVGMALALLLAGPAWSMVSAVRSQPLPVAFGLPTITGWQRSAMPQAYPWKPRFDGADGFVQGRFADARGHVVDVVIARYARQGEGRELVGFGQGAADPDSEWVWSSPASAPGQARGEQITAPGPVVRHVVSFYRVGRGPLTGSAAQVKLATLRARLLADDQRAVAILVSAEDSERHNADAAIGAFLHDAGRVEDLADAAIAIR